MSNRIVVNAIINVLRTILGILFPLITMPHIIKVLNPRDLASFYYYSSILTFFVLLSNFGIPMIAVKDIASTRDSIFKTSYKTSKYLTLNIFLWSISFIFLLIFLWIIGEKRIAGPTLIFFSLSIVNVEYYFQATESFFFLGLRDVLFKIISAVFIFTLLVDQNDFYFYCLTLFIVSLLNSISGILFALKKVKLFIKIKFLKFKFLKETLIIFTMVFLNLLITNIDFVFLKFYDSSDFDTVSYGVALRFYKLAIMILESITIVMVSRAYFNKDFKSPDENLYVRNIFKFGLLFSVIIVVGLILNSKLVINYFTNNKYPDSGLYLQLLSFGIIFSFISNFINSFLLFNYGKINILILTNLISIPFSICLYYFLYSKFSFLGFSIATSLMNVPFIIIFLFINKKVKFINFKPYLLDAINIFLIGFVLFLISFRLCDLIHFKIVLLSIAFRLGLICVLVLPLIFVFNRRLFELIFNTLKG